MKKRHKSFKLLLTALLIGAFLISSTTPIEVQAKVTYASSSKPNSNSQKKSVKKNKTEKYFSDVKKGTQYRSDIEWLAKHGAFKTIAKKGKKFKPTLVITRRQVGTILNNLYGNRIDLTIKDPEKKVTQGFMTETLTTVSKQLGYKVTWKGGAPKARVTRAGACNLIRQMMTAAKGALDPV